MNINSLEDAFVNIGLEEEKNAIEKQLNISIEEGNTMEFLARSSISLFICKNNLKKKNQFIPF